MAAIVKGNPTIWEDHTKAEVQTYIEEQLDSKADSTDVVFEPSTGTGSAKLKNNQAIASGQYSTALGVSYNNTVQTAGGDASIVEGAGNITKSGAQAAHAEGVLNVAGRTQEEAVAALADFPNLGGTTEQKVSKLIGFGSHVEGTTNTALGTSSHAEGNSTQALVNATHAEGDSTIASGEAAHSEGCITTASGNQSHAEGYNTQATANQSHTEGKYTKATSENAHAEGNNTTANGNASHTEGFYTVANNNVEHAEGQYNVSISNVTRHTVGIGYSSQRKNAHTITTDGKHYIPGVGGYLGTENTTSALNERTDVATVINNAENMISITYSALKTKRDNSRLVPGQQYRITNFVTTTTKIDTQSANHPFDIIVVADSVNKLNENARACLHSGDTYFSGVKIESWELKYCLDNDTNRFDWTDSTNGKGVIYWMKDEWGNECPYDFKNIQFKTTITDGQYDSNGTETFVYTFNAYEYNTYVMYDASVICGTVDDGAEVSTVKCVENKIGGYYMEFPDSNTPLQAILVKNLFLMYFAFDEHGSICSYNTINDMCVNNIFGKDCNHNTLGEDCNLNTFGEDCNFNTFGNNCYSNTFGNTCNSNTFGDYCYSNTFGDYCYSNTFGNYCYSNTFGNTCYSNTFGNSCQYIMFGTSDSANYSSSECRSYIRYVMIENGVQYVNLYCTSTTSSNNYCQNIYVSMGVKGTGKSSSSRKNINITSKIGNTGKAVYQVSTSTVTNV